MKRLIFVSGVFCVISVTSAVKLSDHFQICPEKDDNCLNQAIEKAIHYLCENGFPEIKLPKLDPIEVPEINIGTKGNAVDIEQKYRDVKVVGFKNAKVSKAHVDMDKKTLTFITTAPKFEQISNYKINGRILIFPIFGNGTSVLTQSKIAVTHNIQFEEQTKGDKTYWKIKSYVVDMQPEKITFSFENLFNGNKILSDRVHAVVNENWQALWSDSKKDFEETYGKIYTGLAQRLFNKIPIEDIFKSVK